MFNKKAEMGVGTLIVFIAMLLVAAVAAGVLIQTISSLQSKALMTGQQAETQISSNALVIEVSASDGRDKSLDHFQSLMKLSPGSDPIKLDQVIFTFNTRAETATLQFREGGVCEENYSTGYNTVREQDLPPVNTTVGHITLDEDLDVDGTADTLHLINTDNLSLRFVLSTAGTVDVYSGANITDASTTAVPVGLSNAVISDGTTTYGYVTVGTTATNDTLDANVTTVTPYNLGEGFFTVVYEQQGTNWVDGNLQRGDMIRICYESPAEIDEDEELRINFIPKIGTATMSNIITPDVISTERVYLYP